MTEYDNTNRGVLFKNDRKQQDNHPDYTGNINVDGHEFWLSAWIKDGRKGKFMSLSIKPKEQQRTMPVARTDGRSVSNSTRRQSAEMDDEIPF